MEVSNFITKQQNIISMSVPEIIEPKLIFFENNLGKTATRDLVVSDPTL